MLPSCHTHDRSGRTQWPPLDFSCETAEHSKVRGHTCDYNQYILCNTWSNICHATSLAILL